MIVINSVILTILKERQTHKEAIALQHKQKNEQIQEQKPGTKNHRNESYKKVSQTHTPPLAQMFSLAQDRQKTPHKPTQKKSGKKDGHTHKQHQTEKQKTPPHQVKVQDTQEEKDPKS